MSENVLIHLLFFEPFLVIRLKDYVWEMFPIHPLWAKKKKRILCFVMVIGWPFRYRKYYVWMFCFVPLFGAFFGHKVENRIEPKKSQKYVWEVFRFAPLFGRKKKRILSFFVMVIGWPFRSNDVVVEDGLGLLSIGSDDVVGGGRVSPSHNGLIPFLSEKVGNEIVELNKKNVLGNNFL